MLPSDLFFSVKNKYYKEKAKVLNQVRKPDMRHVLSGIKVNSRLHLLIAHYIADSMVSSLHD